MLTYRSIFFGEQIVQAMGGRVGVRSIPQYGCSFIVDIPAQIHRISGEELLPTSNGYISDKHPALCRRSSLPDLLSFEMDLHQSTTSLDLYCTVTASNSHT